MHSFIACLLSAPWGGAWHCVRCQEGKTLPLHQCGPRAQQARLRSCPSIHSLGVLGLLSNYWSSIMLPRVAMRSKLNT